MNTQPTMSPTVKERVKELEDKNVLAEEKQKDAQTITLKEVYERVILLEGKFDSNVQDGKNATARFTWIAFGIFLANLVNIALTLYLVLRGN